MNSNRMINMNSKPIKMTTGTVHVFFFASGSKGVGAQQLLYSDADQTYSSQGVLIGWGEGGSDLARQYSQIKTCGSR